MGSDRLPVSVLVMFPVRCQGMVRLELHRDHDYFGSIRFVSVRVQSAVVSEAAPKPTCQVDERSVVSGSC